MSTTWRAPSRSRWSTERRPGEVVQRRQRREPLRQRGRARCWPARWAGRTRAGDHRQVPGRRHPPLLRRHRRRPATELGFEPQRDFRRRLGRAGRLARRPGGDRPGRRGDARELERGGWWYERPQRRSALPPPGADHRRRRLHRHQPRRPPAREGEHVLVFDNLARPGVERNLPGSSSGSREQIAVVRRRHPRRGRRRRGGRRMRRRCSISRPRSR